MQVRPEKGLFKMEKTNVNLQPAAIHHQFVTVPEGACWAGRFVHLRARSIILGTAQILRWGGGIL